MANTTFKELKRKVYMGFPKLEGEAAMIIDQAVNDALLAISMVRDFDELIVTNEEDAYTATSQKSYNWSTDWSLTRLKKILSIRLMSTTESRKLVWIPPQELDDVLPYVETISEGKSTHYTQNIGSGNFELIPIPDDVYPLYIRYSQWPAILTNETDTTPYAHLDTQTIFLAKDIANAYLSGDYFDFAQRAQGYLTAGVKEDMREPDQLRVAKPFNPNPALVTGEYWKYPFVRRNP